MESLRFVLPQSEIPTHWYNVVADMPNPASGDLIRIGAEDFIVQGEPKADRERLIWTLNMRAP